MQLTKASREADGGRTEVTIAAGIIYIDIYRNECLVEQRKYQASDLINRNVDRLLVSSGISWSDFKNMLRGG